MSNLFTIQVANIDKLLAPHEEWLIGQYLRWTTKHARLEWTPTDRLADAKFFSTAAACLQALRQINCAHPYLTLKTLQFKQV